MFLLFSGCANTLSSEKANNPNSSNESPLSALAMLPTYYREVDDLLSSIGMAKFSEFAEVDHSDPHRTIFVLQGLSELFVPGYVKQGFTLSAVSVQLWNILTLLYDDITTEEYKNFVWARHISAENATTDFFDRGEIRGYIREFFKKPY